MKITTLKHRTAGKRSRASSLHQNQRISSSTRWFFVLVFTYLFIFLVGTFIPGYGAGTVHTDAGAQHVLKGFANEGFIWNSQTTGQKSHSMNDSEIREYTLTIQRQKNHIEALTKEQRELKETISHLQAPIPYGKNNSNAQRAQTIFSKNEPKYAYTWLIGGIDPARPAYKGFLYDVLISVNLLQKLGSKADYLLLIQISHSAAGISKLPADDERILAEIGIQTVYLPKPKKASFAQLVYEKFRPLGFTKYSRVMFLDADTIPLVNLDYLFHLSEGPNPVLKPNLIMATRGEPCNTGMFIMHPEQGAWEEMQHIIDRQHQIGQTLPYPHFDWENGWGHSFIQHNDRWEALHKSGVKWRYHAGHSDQGLWYYFVKYYKQSGSIVIGDRLQTVSPGSFGQPELVNEEDVLWNLAPEPIVYIFGCTNKKSDSNHLCSPVYRDFAHFMGSEKPWSKSPCDSCGNKLHPAHRLWYQELAEINMKVHIGLDMENFEKRHLPALAESPLGYIAAFTDHQEYLQTDKTNVTKSLDLFTNSSPSLTQSSK
jgi:hypothetical protein